MFYPFANYQKKIGKILIKKGVVLSTAESCTGGLISSLLTDVSGKAKEKYLFVSAETLNNYGSVSEQTAKEMALGILKQTDADYALGITGIAGPTGGTAKKPVGLCYVGLANDKEVIVKKILMPKFLPRKIMKFFFAKRALFYLKEFLEV